MDPLNVPAGADWRERAGQQMLTVEQLNELALGFCGYLTADVPQLHGIHPQRLADAWKRYTGRVADGSIHGFAQDGEG